MTRSPLWNKQGQRVAGIYLGAYTVTGTVVESRLCSGGAVRHELALDQPMKVFGRTTQTLLLEDEELFTGHRLDLSQLT